MFVNINLLKPTFLGPTPTVLDSVGLVWVPIICIFNRSPDAADAADATGLGDHGLRTTGLGPYENMAPQTETTPQEGVWLVLSRVEPSSNQ